MNRKILGGWLRPAIAVVLPALALMTPTAANSALIGVQKVYPDINQATTDINNVYVNTDATHVWQMTINGTATNNQTTQNVQWFLGDVNHTICETQAATCDSGTPYTLTAYFDADGNFTTGSITIDGYIDGSTATGYQVDVAHGLGNTGSILDATLTEFGFSGTAGTTSYDQLQLDFRFTLDNTLSDFNQLFGAGFHGGVLWNGRVQTGQVNQVWTQADFAHAFSCSGITGCNATMDTFVPLPAAVWLFGSGLLGLFGAGAYSRKARG